MSYDGIVTMAIARQLRDELTLGKIEKIYQPQPEQLIFSIHTKEGRRLLFLSAAANHPATYMVSAMTENPLSPPPFCMALRKHLSAARIVDISQRDGERIIYFDMETMDEMGFSVNRRLVAEIMGKHSNILLLDMATGRIIDSIKHISMGESRIRQALPGLEYTDPPPQEKIPFTKLTADDLSRMISSEMQPERDIMDHVQGISFPVAQCIAEAGMGEALEPSSSARDFDPAAAAAYLGDMIARIEDRDISPCVYVNEDGKPADFHAFPLPVYEDDPSLKRLDFGGMSEAAEYYYQHRESSNILSQKSSDIKRVIKTVLDKQRLKLQRLNEDMRKAEDSDRYRLYGELLTANIHMVEPGSKEVTVTNYYDESDISIPLDPRYSPSRNAQQYYKKYSKAKTAVKEKAVQISETQKEIEYLESVASFAEQADSLEVLDQIRRELTDNGFIRYRKKNKGPSKKSKPSPHTYTLTSGLTAMAGRNNRENDWLTMKRAAGSDLWFHTKDIPGSHVILFLEGAKATEQDLFEAASIAAFHSKGSASSNVPVDYTLVRHVKKPAGARDGMVIFTHNKTLYVEPRLPGEDDIS